MTDKVSQVADRLQIAWIHTIQHITVIRFLFSKSAFETDDNCETNYNFGTSTYFVTNNYKRGQQINKCTCLLA